MIVVFTYKPGDSVWLMHKNKAVCGTVTSTWFGRFISCVDYETISENESYYVSIEGKRADSFERKKLFTSKEELLKSL